MRLTTQEKKEYINHIKELLSKNEIYDMMNYMQHGNTTTFTHCLIVSYYSYLLALRLPIVMDTKSVARGAMLHDFYLYDWHIPHSSHKLHGYVHPKFALDNAKKHFTLNAIEEDIIEKHMWPLTLRKLPRCREAVLVSIVDKVCSLSETFYLPIIPKDYKRMMKKIERKVSY